MVWLESGRPRRRAARPLCSSRVVLLADGSGSGFPRSGQHGYPQLHSGIYPVHACTDSMLLRSQCLHMCPVGLGDWLLPPRLTCLIYEAAVSTLLRMGAGAASRASLYIPQDVLGWLQLIASNCPPHDKTPVVLSITAQVSLPHLPLAGPHSKSLSFVPAKCTQKSMASMVTGCFSK